MNDVNLRSLTISEQVALENYKGASKEALSAASSVADKIVAAAFSFATAYGAVIALVAPEEAPEPVVAALPFVFFALAAGLALWGQSRGVGLTNSTEVADLEKAVNGAVVAKRRWSQGALALLVIGVIVAGVIMHDNYAEPAQGDSSIAVEAWLTPAGKVFVGNACGGAEVTKLRGTVESKEALSAMRVGLTVAKAMCPAGAGTLYFGQRMLVGVKEAGSEQEAPRTAEKKTDGRAVAPS